MTTNTRSPRQLAFGALWILVAGFAGQAQAQIYVSTPASGAVVTSPFVLEADTSQCEGEGVLSMGYSIDGGALTTVSGNEIPNTSLAASVGSHTIKVTAQSSDNKTCTQDVSITVSATSARSIIPSSSDSVSNINDSSDWKCAWDSGTGSSPNYSTCSYGIYPFAPGGDGLSLMMQANAQANSGLRFSVSFGQDDTTENFFYDGYVYLNSDEMSITNIEMDMNQVIPNGDTVIYGFQCDGISKTWDYSENSGTDVEYSGHWIHSGQACDPLKWAPLEWHHVQIYYSRDASGDVTYHSVWLDGAEQDINGTVYSEYTLGWSPATLLTNFQLDTGSNGGEPQVYLDQLTISRW
ncbi:MAG TPA: hypothetical protein VHU89_17710 [Acidobacteriaceae bacterium]|jgi:hypothetical protein|nr:hypothetical protein [Acidobacteriaceae bacterium]